ncbi:MAG TPA: GyrI-like domain-containing protein [Paludibacter sp.]|nr:GyrI-like domain-containing protein [Prolixibacteraceae bacterium]
MKHEWKKSEKNFYFPNVKPEQIVVPKFNFYTIQGEGNPNDDNFAEYVGVLFSLSYAIKMGLKSAEAVPKNYNDYAVYPLEGVWDINEEAKRNMDGKLDKNTLVYKLMIRQPAFITADFAAENIEVTKRKKPHQLLDQVKFETIEEGSCVQMLHMGSFDNEPLSFKLMEQFAEEQQLKRKSLTHREIYLSDARKTIPERLRTILRFQVE